MNTPSPYSHYDTVSNLETTYRVDLLTALPTVEWASDGNLDIVGDTNYQPSFCYASDVDDDGYSASAALTTAYFDGSEYTTNYTVVGCSVCIDYDDGTTLFELYPFPKATTIGPGTDAIEVDLDIVGFKQFAQSELNW